MLDDAADDADADDADADADDDDDADDGNADDDANADDDVRNDTFFLNEGSEIAFLYESFLDTKKSFVGVSNAPFPYK